ncbi:unnamed protein product [Arabidopsis arenosa]|uniref:Uncharacterized protein n=1 Tax=Arabidopsis arenosa TaxID=38785 RepID=A0A8S1ZX25_ARAAE|nr:unnamed protein product [Arabidopsis arenosa]
METTPETQSKTHQSGSNRVPAGREDWWSEDATATLIEAWGDRYVNLNRGNLRQNDWKEHRKVEDVDPSEGSAFRELARSILKLGEAFERIEGKKQQMMIELEKQRMEVAKELELQRMNMLMEMQLELEKSKLGKRRAASGKKL